MKNKLLTSLLVCISVLIATNPLKAGNSVDQKLFESLHGHGSINVVFVGIAIILLGLLFTLFRLDRRVSLLEEKNK